MLSFFSFCSVETCACCCFRNAWALLLVVCGWYVVVRRKLNVGHV